MIGLTLMASSTIEMFQSNRISLAFDENLLRSDQVPFPAITLSSPFSVFDDLLDLKLDYNQMAYMNMIAWTDIYFQKYLSHINKTYNTLRFVVRIRL